jgi:rhamnose utilization protein RhaD (predicted bifunctional aldolase and dehydrogenase)/NAD(P)-dependent dehydrogenase (short-subunit alcohol dehydrogenase family)
MKKINDFQMINYLKKYMIDTTFPNASVETLLHSFLPHKYIDHTHSNAILSLIDQPNDKNICKKIFGNDLGLVPYIMPGFELSKKASEVFEKNPKVQGLILLNHGIFTFGDSAKQSYERMIKFVSIAERELTRKLNTIPKKQYKENKVTASNLSNIFRKYTSIPLNDDYDRKIICYSNPSFLNQFFNKNIFTKINGPVTPDHVIRIKYKPLFLDFTNVKSYEIEKLIKKHIINYQKKYINYFNRNKHLNKNAKMHDPSPRLIVVKGIGLFSTGKNFKEAKIAMDVGINSLSVMIDAFRYDKFKSIPEKEIFRMEYWPLELAKLKKSNLPLQGNITVITGGLGTIGYKTALKFLKEGSEVVILDNIKNDKKINGMSYFKCDVTIESEINKVLKKISEKYGGIDIIISNAGFAIQRPLKDIDKNVLDKSFAINFFAHHYLAQQSVEIFKRQSTGGSILFNISKQAINPGENFASYGLPKATLLFLMKQYALEFGKYGIRFNGINADRVKSGLMTKEVILKRAKTRGLSLRSYMSGNLLKKEVKPEDVANAFFYLSRSLKTTACIMTVDGGNIEASLR